MAGRSCHRTRSWLAWVGRLSCQSHPRSEGCFGQWGTCSRRQGNSSQNHGSGDCQGWIVFLELDMGEEMRLPGRNAGHPHHNQTCRRFATLISACMCQSPRFSGSHPTHSAQHHMMSRASCYETRSCIHQTSPATQTTTAYQTRILNFIMVHESETTNSTAFLQWTS